MKKIYTAISLAVALVLLVSPLVSFAEDLNNSQEGEKTTAACSKILDKLSSLQKTMDSWKTKIEAKEQSIKNSINGKRDNRISALGNIRTKWDQNLEKHFDKLRERAGDSQQKEAVEKFITAVNAASQIRKDAFNKAVQEFQSELDNLIASRQASVKQKTEDYKKAVNDAYAKAKTSCEEGAPLSDIQQVLRSALSQAKDQYKNTVARERNYVDEMQVLVKEKRDAIKEATDIYHLAIQNAITELKAVFKDID